MHRVLVVEDDKDVREALRDIVALHGYSVETAENGMQALDRLNEDPLPDAIVLDLMMPVMDGYAFLQVKKFDARIRHVPVIMVTANWSRVKEIDGVVHVLQKPISVPQFLEALDRITGKPR